MAITKKQRKELDAALKALDKRLDAEFDDALQATLKAIEASESGKVKYVRGTCEDPVYEREPAIKSQAKAKTKSRRKRR